jgi:DNA-binding transcriptional LysR family regulator
VAAPDHCLAAEQQLDAAHLRTTDLLGTEPGCAYRDKMVEWLNRTDTDPVPVLEFGTIEAIKRTVQSRLGVALLPTVTVADELALGSLVELPWKAPFQVYTRLVWDEAKWVSPELELFISEATRVMREEADSACAVA